MKTKKEIEQYIKHGYDECDASGNSEGIECYDWLGGELDKSKSVLSFLNYIKKENEHSFVSEEIWDKTKMLIKFIENI